MAILHEKGLSVMAYSASSLRHIDCKGLNQSHIESSSFDHATPTRAYAATEDGDLLTLIIEKNLIECMVNG